MKKSPAFLCACAAMSVFLFGCGATPASTADPGPTEFVPHEVTYGGDTEEVLTRERFVSLWQENYQKSAKYKNGYATLTCDKPFYQESDANDYFRNFDELRFAVILNDEDRGFAMEKLFMLMPVSFDAEKLYAPNIHSYHLGRAIADLNYDIRISSDYEGGIDTFYQYKLKGEGIEILFSEDYYPVKATWTFEDAAFEMNFKYFGISDLPNSAREVDRETFLLHACARANQRLTVNDLRVDLSLANAIVGREYEYDETYGVEIMKYTYGNGLAKDHARLTSLGADKTALPLISDISKTITHEYTSNDFNEDEMATIRGFYFDATAYYAFNGAQAISDASFGGWGDKTESKFFLSPLRTERREFYRDEQTGGYVLGKTYKYEFNNDGLLSRYSINGNGETALDEASFVYTYSSVAL